MQENPYRLDGKVAIVTGAARGIGAAIAEQFALAGAAAVILTDVLEAEGAATAERLAGHGAQTLFLRHDVASEADWERVVGEARGRFGGLDVLVNNAGICFYRPIADTSLAEFKRLMGVNVDGVFLGIKAAAPALAERAAASPWGSAIVNVSSVAGIVGAGAGIAYHGSKGAVRLMTKSAAIELGRKRVRVNSVHPGIIDTDMNTDIASTRVRAGMLRDVAEHNERVSKLNPLGRIGEAVDPAAIALFLASDASKFVTGSEFVVDGGLTAQ